MNCGRLKVTEREITGDTFICQNSMLKEERRTVREVFLTKTTLIVVIDRLRRREYFFGMTFRLFLRISLPSRFHLCKH